MNKFLAMLVLLCISVPLHAQTNYFELPEGAVNISYEKELGNGNHFQVGLFESQDLQRMANIDSLLQVFLDDIVLLKDSLADPLTGKQIVYVFNAPATNLLRIRQTKAAYSTFVTGNGQAAVLRVMQDTVYLLGKVDTVNADNGMPHFFRITVTLNRLTELLNYIGTGVFEKSAIVATAKKTVTDAAGRSSVPVIKQADYYQVHLAVAMQNYTNIFLPSFVAGVERIFVNRTAVTNIGFSSEFLFSFDKDGLGKRTTHVNELLTLYYGRDTKKPSRLTGMRTPLYFSLGYLLRKRGDLLDAHSFRLGAGRIQFHNGALRIEPQAWFHDLFKAVSPGVRLLVSF